MNRHYSLPLLTMSSAVRERGLFPLPIAPSFEFDNSRGLSRGTSRRIKRRLASDMWCAQGIQALNELSGFPFLSPASEPANDAQAVALESISELYSRGPSPRVN